MILYSNAKHQIRINSNTNCACGKPRYKYLYIHKLTLYREYTIFSKTLCINTLWIKTILYKVVDIYAIYWNNVTPTEIKNYIWNVVILFSSLLIDTWKYLYQAHHHHYHCCILVFIIVCSLFFTLRLKILHDVKWIYN